METIDEIVAKATFPGDDGRAHKPRVNEFVSAYDAVPNGNASPYRRGQTRVFGRIKTITDKGTTIEVWSYKLQRFEGELFVPVEAVDCIVARHGVTPLSFMGVC